MHDVNKERPPKEPSALARWFAEAVRSEIAAMEKDGGAQKYELLSGKLINRIASDVVIYDFVVADGTRIPEEADGRLKTTDAEYSAAVVGQQVNRIQIQLSGITTSLPRIARATLFIDDTALLRKLADLLEEVGSGTKNIGPLATQIFSPEHAHSGTAPLPETKAFDRDRVDDELRVVLEKSCGSTLTYIWGPPGTGKTYCIARLIAALVERGERVLVSSHTNAAVDQALYAAVRREPGNEGPLTDHPEVLGGRVIRVGHCLDSKIPEEVLLDRIIAKQGAELEEEISTIREKIRPLTEQRERCRAELAEWQRLETVTSRLATVQAEVSAVHRKREIAERELLAAEDKFKGRREALQRARTAWLFRKTRVEHAMAVVDEAASLLAAAEQSVAELQRESTQAQEALASLEGGVQEQTEKCAALDPQESIAVIVDSLTSSIQVSEERLAELQGLISQLAQSVIDDASVILCTLTKTYLGSELDGQEFDAVIVDEISMALPPLLFLAGGRATRRVILVGDFLQLPPIVRSDAEISSERLRQDAFHLAGIAHGAIPDRNSNVLAHLKTQRRMSPRIADVARNLAYGPDGIRDHIDVFDRKPKEWMDFLGEAPLLIVDTADLYCWSGKQPGSLSRFNLYSATLSVEIAAMAAAKIPEPLFGEPPPIGIVTPFAAQRRLLARMVSEMNLGRWVACGTVHTFQGGEADLIIFDAVLDEPYWSARLCTPKDAEDVKRDLNVAVTRAKHKLVFVGSSEWLNARAKPSSGLGKLWAFLKDRAELISAFELVESGFAQRVASHSEIQGSWTVPDSGAEASHEILDEVTFFDRFDADLSQASVSIFGLVPFFGQYRWPRVQPLIAAALDRGVDVTLVIPPLAEANNETYVREAVRNLRALGAMVVSASGLHGKEIIIDERIHYTGSLNWASHRGRQEVMHRTVGGGFAKLVLQYLQVKFIPGAIVHEDGSPRTCPFCGGPTRIVNQRRQRGRWDFQALKIGCANYKETNCKYLRDLEERAPFKDCPRCEVDGKTKYRRVRHGRGETWKCPKHPRECPSLKVVPGDPN